MKMTPSEYIAKHFHFSIIRDPLALEYTDKIPVDNLMWGSDFPHSVGSFPHSQEFIESAFKGKDELKKKVLLENPARYFKLDLSKEITPTPAAA
jgi:predicted TIM-barrel fold metal-dependent hydrolase